MLNKSGGIISESAFDSMLEVQYSPDPGLSIKMGLGFQVKRIFNEYAFGHNGGISGGWNTVMLLLPEADLGVMIHLNLTSGLVDSTRKKSSIMPSVRLSKVIARSLSLSSSE